MPANRLSAVSIIVSTTNPDATSRIPLNPGTQAAPQGALTDL
jgi:hypothetical protein